MEGVESGYLLDILWREWQAVLFKTFFRKELGLFRPVRRENWRHSFACIILIFWKGERFSSPFSHLLNFDRAICIFSDLSVSYWVWVVIRVS